MGQSRLIEQRLFSSKCTTGNAHLVYVCVFVFCGRCGVVCFVCCVCVHMCVFVYCVCSFVRARARVCACV